jgi:tryptophan 2,3-dioxygenase
MSTKPRPEDFPPESPHDLEWGGYNHEKYEAAMKAWEAGQGKAREIKDERDYAIRKGKVLERFSQDFFTRHRNNHLYRQVYEALIRDADPYEIIEKIIEINDEMRQEMLDMLPFVSPNYALLKKNKQ